jgi:DNA-binding XRE family transcriptional regulator
MPEILVRTKLKTRRILADLTQEDLAKKVGVTRQTVLAIEKGNYAPSVLLAIRLAKALGCTVEDLFDEDAE